MEEATFEADSIMNKAKAKSETIIEEAKQQASQLIARAEKEGAIEKAKIIEQKKAVADIDGRKIVLEKKQEMIESCFDRAMTKILTMETEKYVAFLASVVKKSKVTEGELILSKNDMARVGEQLISTLKELIPEGNFSLSHEERELAGGLIIKSGKIYINGTVDSMLLQAKAELSNDVARVLFN